MTNTDVKVGAVNVKTDIVFVAKSRMEPPLGSRVVFTTIPSVSNSPTVAETVYLKSAVLLSVIETYVAYLVCEPTVNTNRGVPVIVTDSLKFIVKVGVSEGLYVAFAGATTEEIIGAV
jgi:hypothetical protein